MSGNLGVVLERAADRERRDAVRHLLAHPLTGQREDSQAWAAIVRRRRELVDWFAEHTGWQLVVDESGGLARLHKVPARDDDTRPARAPTSSARSFDRRRYSLLCLVLAALDATPGQTTLRHVAEDVADRSHDLAGVQAFDATRYGERRALVDVLRLLVELGVLAERDGDTERFVRADTGDALYDVDDRRLAQLVAAPSSPSLVDDPADLPVEVYPDSEEGRRLRARHMVTRRLLDDPVVHYDDLGEREVDWLSHALGFVHDLLDRDVGLVVERRAEGLLAVDPARELTDETFPDGGSTAKHAALLLAELLTDRVRTARAHGHDVPVLDDTEVVALVAELREAYAQRCEWAATYRDDDGTALARDALGLLARFGLVTAVEHGWQPRPAIARFAPQTVAAQQAANTTSPDASATMGDAARAAGDAAAADHDNDPGQLDLLGDG